MASLRFSVVRLKAHTKVLQLFIIILFVVLNSSKIKCRIPSLKYINYNTDNLEYCKTKNDYLEVDTLVYTAAQKYIQDKSCSSICKRTVFKNILNGFPMEVLAKDLKA